MVNTFTSVIFSNLRLSLSLALSMQTAVEQPFSTVACALSPPAPVFSAARGKSCFHFGSWQVLLFIFHQ